MEHRPGSVQTDRKRPHRSKVVVSVEDWYVATSIDLDIASQGKTGEETLSNLAEALELFFETADDAEVEQRLRGTS